MTKEMPLRTGMVRTMLLEKDLAFAAAGAGRLLASKMLDRERAVCSAIEQGKDTDKWRLDDVHQSRVNRNPDAARLTASKGTARLNGCRKATAQEMQGW